jgi:NAD(P)-dependent dehydrogenase (short-subunit alcohol dehydrogenase family)
MRQTALLQSTKSRKRNVMRPLEGKIAVVTGASRGIGKGTACVLAEKGATVYITARTVENGSRPLPGSLFETVAEIERRGGKAIGFALDLHNESAISDLFARVEADHGRLDLLVNNAMAIPASMTDKIGFWEKPLNDELAILDTGVRAAFIASSHAAKMMTRQRCGLIVGMSGYVGRTYTYDVMFGVTKTATDRMARDMAIELKPHGVASLSLWQGFTYTERAIENLKSVPQMASQLNTAVGSSPEFPGRIIAALATDNNILAKTGGSWIVAELASEYGLTDTDGRIIPSLRAERGAPIFEPI